MAASEKRQLELDILANAKTAKGTSEAARDLDKVARAADDAERHVDDLNKTTVVAGKETAEFAKESRSAADKVKDLDHEISGINKELVQLANAFHSAGDASERLDISKAIRRTENDLRRVTKNRNLISGSILPDPDPGETTNWLAKVRSVISNGLKAEPLITGGIVLGAALAPVIGGAIAGAVLGGVGAGGVIGGVALAAQQPEVSQYAKRIGATFAEGIKAEAKDTFTGPTMAGLSQLEALAARSVPKIGEIFRNTAPGVDILAQAIGRSVDALLDATVTASGQSQPALAALGRMFQQVAEDTGDFISMLADHSDEGVSAIDDITTALHWTVEGVTAVIRTFIDWYGVISDVGGALGNARNWLEDHGFALDLTADGYKKGSAAAELYRKGIIGAKGAVNDYDHYLAGPIQGTKDLAGASKAAADAALGHKNALVDLSKEMRAEADPVFGLITAQQNLTEAQTNVAKATKDHGKDSKEAKKAVQDLALAAIDLQGKVGALGDSFTGELTPAMRGTLRAGGLTEGQIDQVAQAFRNAKRDGDAYAKVYRAKVITDYISRYTSIVSSAAQSSYEETKRSLQKRAAGGSVQRGVPYWVGEQGPEIMMPDAAGRVLSAASSRGVGANAGRNGGGGWPAGGITAQIEVIGDEEIRTLFRRLIKRMNLLETA